MKHYVDVVNSTLTESVLRNVSLQANANFVDELVGELNSENESLKKQIQEMGENLQRIISEKDSSVNEFMNNKKEIENVRHQLTHLDTFRNQLIESNKTIEKQNVELEDLRNKIEELQTPPKKKKTIVVPKFTEVSTEEPLNSTVKDGGTF